VLPLVTQVKTVIMRKDQTFGYLNPAVLAVSLRDKLTYMQRNTELRPVHWGKRDGVGPPRVTPFRG